MGAPHRADRQGHARGRLRKARGREAHPCWRQARRGDVEAATTRLRFSAVVLEATETDGKRTTQDSSDIFGAVAALWAPVFQAQGGAQHRIEEWLQRSARQRRMRKVRMPDSGAM